MKTACPLEVPQPVQASPGTLRTAREAASAADLWPVNPWEAVCPSDSPGIGLAPNFPPLPTLHPQGPPFLSPPKGNWHFLPLEKEVENANFLWVEREKEIGIFYLFLQRDFLRLLSFPLHLTPTGSC